MIIYKSREELIIMAKTKDELVNEIMLECKALGEPVTKEEAEEMAAMELKANTNRHYEKSTEPRKKAERVKKVDTEKVDIIKLLDKALKDGGFDTTIVNEQGEITFKNFSVKLIRHTKKK